MTALRTMTDSANRTASANLLSSVQREHFQDEVSIEVFDRITASLERDSRIPKWDELVLDPMLSETAREDVDTYREIAPVRRERRIGTLFRDLDHYRKLRMVYFRSEENIRVLEGKSVDADRLVSDNVDLLLRAQVNARKQDQIISIGVGAKDNSDTLFESLLSGDRASVIRTGFKTFDERNGGIMLGSLMIVAATTGGGKTAMKTQLEISMAAAGNRVCGVPLEMSDKEQLARHVANVSGVDVKKYLFTPLTRREARHTRRAWKNYKEEIEHFGGALRIFEPEEDMSIQEILTLLRPYNDEVIIIDYISLLKGVDGDDSWRQLSAAARYAKIWAKNNNRVVILLAQLSDEGALRYSKGVMEHANNMWAWTYADKNRESGVIDIMQPKARNQEAFEFQLGHDFSTMRIYDLDGEQDDLSRDERRGPQGRKRFEAMSAANDGLQEEVAQDMRRRERRNRTGRHRDTNRDRNGTGGRRRESRRQLKDRSA